MKQPVETHITTLREQEALTITHHALQGAEITTPLQEQEVTLLLLPEAVPLQDHILQVHPEVQEALAEAGPEVVAAEEDPAAVEEEEDNYILIPCYLYG